MRTRRAARPGPLVKLVPTIAVFTIAASSFAYAANDWPTHYAFGDGSDLGLIGMYRYDVNEFSNDMAADGSHAYADSATNRRKEFGLRLKKKGVYSAVVDYEYQGKSWLDVNLRLYSKAFLGKDYGAFRFGYSKTPVSFEGNTSTKATSFLELSLPAQAMFEGRRTGIDWQYERPGFIVNLGCYTGQDLVGDNDGTTIGGRIAWTPHESAGDVMHLGVSASQEDRDATRDGRGVDHPPSARFRTPPEAGLTPVRLVDSGTLSNAGRIRRGGLEGLWIGGPWSVQGEALRAEVSRYGGMPNFAARGFYLFASWVATGESRPYRAGNVGNVNPDGRGGAWEFLLRYSTIDLDDGAIRGGREHDWTLGANWYLDDHFKFQANYIRASIDRGSLAIDPRIFELRAQLAF